MKTPAQTIRIEGKQYASTEPEHPARKLFRAGPSASPAPDPVDKYLADPADRTLLRKWDAAPLGSYGIFTQSELRRIRPLLSLRDRVHAEAARAAESSAAQPRAAAPAVPHKKFQGNTPSIQAAKRYAQRQQVTGRWTGEQARRHVTAAICKAN
jgi:hypothetical protein